MSFRQGIAVVAASSFVALSGCAGGSGYDPGAAGLPMGASCKSIRSQLNKLDSQGVPSLVERSGRGGKLNSGQKAKVDQYNRLLSQYLGARCHV